MIAVDVSNWGGPLSAETVAAWKAAAVGKVIVGIDLGHIPLAQQQLRAASDGGLEIEAYRFCYWGTDIRPSLQRIADAIQGLPVGRVWLDFEDQNAPENAHETICKWIQQNLDAGAALWEKVGCYTAAWWWNPYTGNSDRFKDWPLWVAQYDGDASLDFKHFGGWTRCALKQYAGTTNFYGYSVDLNCYEEEDVTDEEARKLIAIQEAKMQLSALAQSGKFQDLANALKWPWGIVAK